jgi:excisionase family DNA binding protein
MNDFKWGFKLLDVSQEDIFIGVQEASQRFKYSDQYLRKLLRNEKIHGIKIGQLWLIACKSLLQYIEIASSTEDLRYGPHGKLNKNEKSNFLSNSMGPS